MRKRSLSQKEIATYRERRRGLGFEEYNEDLELLMTAMLTHMSDTLRSRTLRSARDCADIPPVLLPYVNLHIPPRNHKLFEGVWQPDDDDEVGMQYTHYYSTRIGLDFWHVHTEDWNLVFCTGGRQSPDTIKINMWETRPRGNDISTPSLRIVHSATDVILDGSPSAVWNDLIKLKLLK